MHLDFRKTIFRIGDLQKNRGAANCKNMSTEGVTIQPNSMKKWTLELNQKAMLKNTAHKKSTILKKQLPNRSMTLFWGWRLLGHLWWPNPLLDIRSGPQRSESASEDRNMIQKWHQRAPRLRKKTQKSRLVEAFFSGLREAPTVRLTISVFPKSAQWSNISICIECILAWNSS